LHNLPQELLSSLTAVPGYDETAFQKVHSDGARVVSIRYNPLKLGRANPSLQPAHNCDLPVPGGPLPGDQKIPWSSFGYYLDKRPSFTFDPLFHAGLYYVQEASGMFLEQALRQTMDLNKPLRVLDLCAAPGGKSTLIQSLISRDSLLVSNETIRARVASLQENMVKWGAANAIITHNDPRDFSGMENYFDVLVVDAPCSGSGLFRRDPEAIGEWSLDSVSACSQRQQRILADCWPSLRHGGVLIYSTCSYSAQEDEDILDWLIGECGAESLRLSTEANWNIVETVGKKAGYGYRFYPDRLKGEGFFIAAVRKSAGGEFAYPRNRKMTLARPTKQEESQARNWLRQDLPLQLFSHNEQLFGLPAHLAQDLSYLQSCCYIRLAGILTGRAGVKEFIPEHELALSELISHNLPSVALSKEEAIQYLRKEEIRLPAGASGKGWTLVQYEGYNLGWIKILPGRINNYYPKELRILKRS
jgi:16S rRNA C967 or C1407 C5-methylase (RsmB/RsmF family)/NOL1/NOP2/fmu family ribosome biogenesis protein